jgi:Insertion element 4 transposase N-terminal
MVYFAMALALFADDDYEEVAVRLTETLEAWGCWDREWTAPTSGGITSARKRLGPEPMVEVFDQVAVPVADELTRGGFLGLWRLMSIDGIEWDTPDTPENAAAFGYPGSTDNPSAFPKVRMVTIAECASHTVVAAVIGAQRPDLPTRGQTRPTQLLPRQTPHRPRHPPRPPRDHQTRQRATAGTRRVTVHPRTQPSHDQLTLSGIGPEAHVVGGFHAACGSSRLDNQASKSVRRIRRCPLGSL